MHPLFGSIGTMLMVTGIALLFRGPEPLDPPQKYNWTLRVAIFSLIGGALVLFGSFSLVAFKR